MVQLCLAISYNLSYFIVVTSIASWGGPCSSRFMCGQYNASCTEGCCFVIKFSVGSRESRKSFLEQQSCNSGNGNSKGRQFVSATYPTAITD
ncbi:hypothetical protein BD560DRAFT_405465 [Blakeslea trispora]|nr:hypothetical protein BD560DRAFT_405465 [Blakeslea trispora]